MFLSCLYLEIKQFIRGGEGSSEGSGPEGMGVRVMRCLLFLLGLLFCSGNTPTESDDGSRSLSSLVINLPLQNLEAEKQTQKHLDHELKKNTNRMLFTSTKLKSTQMDVITPITTVPMINPTAPTATTTYPPYNPIPTPSNPTTPIVTPTPGTTNPYTTPTTNPYTAPTTTTPTTNPYTAPTTTTPTTSPYTTPTTTTPTSSGQSWCVASQTASQTALQVALDYACGYGGADCSAIQPGGSCYNPDTVRDHASYAFNNYYQKNPTQTSCDFGGTAMITNTDPSTSTCQYPSTSTSSTVLNTTNPTGSTVFGSEPPATSGTASMSIRMPLIFMMACILRSLYLNVFTYIHED